MRRRQADRAIGADTSRHRPRTPSSGAPYPAPPLVRRTSEHALRPITPNLLPSQGSRNRRRLHPHLRFIFQPARIGFGARARYLARHDRTARDFSEIADNFSFLDDWEDRYKYLIELGQALPPLPESARTPENKVSGCVSQVWLVATRRRRTTPTRIFFEGDSDAMIVKGLVAVLLALYSGPPRRRNRRDRRPCRRSTNSGLANT